MQETGCFSSKGLPYLFLAPQILVIFIFFIWPASQTLFESFIVKNAVPQSHYLIGLQNYVSLFTNPSYLASFGMTLFFSFCITVITLIIGLFLAALVQGVNRGKTFYSVLLCIPFAVAPPVAGIIMYAVFTSYATPIFSLMSLMILTTSWQQVAYNFIFYLIGLHRIPSYLIDSAKLDGACVYQRLWHITLPLLAPITFFLFITNVMYDFFNTFGLVQVMTQPASGNPAQLLILKVYQDGFVNGNVPTAAAQSVILMIVAGILMALLFRHQKNKKIF